MTERVSGKRFTATLIAGALALAACSSGGDGGAPETTPDSEPGSTGDVVINRPAESSSRPARPSDAASTATGSPGEPSGVTGLRLSEGAPAPATPIVTVTGTPLDDEQISAIIDRLPDWDLPDDDGADLRLPEQTLPPPRVGLTRDEAFPPPPTERPPTSPSTEPLEVLRAQPTGDVDVAPFLSVTFNQPMVPLATHAQLDDAEVPATMSPEVPGRWRWIGTRTLRFEVEPGETDRLPQATDYRIEIPAGTESATGSTLDDAFVWEFSTPPPTIERFFPGESDSLPLDPLFFLAFDQLIDPASVLATITLDADGARGLRLASDREIAADAEVADAVATALPGRWLAFRPVDELPADTAVELRVGPGTPSPEGPRTTTEVEQFDMRTFAPLRIVDHECGYDGECVPLMPFTIEFNNPLDPASVTPARIAITPELPGARVDVIGSTIQVNGASSGSRTYDVTLDGAIADVFGQTLGETETVSFDVGPAQPAVYGLDRNFITLDPSAERPGVAVSTVNHDRLHVQAWAVSAADYRSYVRYQEQRWSDVAPPVPDWPAVLDTTIEVDAAQDELVETFVDLADELAESGGQLVVEIAPDPAVPPEDDDFWMNQPRVAWVQSTGLAVDAIIADRELLIWTTDLATGAPLGDVTVELLGRGDSVTTDGDGLARVELTGAGVEGLVATTATDSAMLPAGWFDGWTARPSSDDTRWYVFDDRGVYRPGETVRLRGWLRRFGGDERQLDLVAAGSRVAYRAYDPQGNVIAEQEVALDALGGFGATIELPSDVNLGSAWVELELLDDRTSDANVSGHEFQIQEFRTPEFEVSARHETPGPYYAHEPVVVAVDAAYFAGGPLPNADVTWAVTSRTTSYEPPGHDEFTFGIWQPWWWFDTGGFTGAEPALDVVGDAAVDGCFDCPFGEETFEQFEGVTDANGSHYLQIDVEGPEVDQPATVTAEATVFDVNRQGWADRTDALVHPAALYVGLRSDDTFVEPGTPLEIDAIVTDVDGELVPGREIAIEAGRLEWTYADGEWGEELVDVEPCSVTSELEPVTCTFGTPVGGSYEITAIVTDDAGRTNRTVLTRWVSGGELPPQRTVEQERVEIVPDADEYAPGDTAELLVQAPFAPASGLMTVIRGGIEWTASFDAPDGSAVLRVPIEEANVPNLTVQVDMTGSAERVDDAGDPLPDLPRRPAFATGQIELPIPPVTRALAVEVTPETAALEPGTDTAVTVRVTDASGAPVAGADVAVVVVDEAVLSVTGYELDDPLDAFYRPITSEVFGEYLRSSIVLTRPDLLGGGGDGAEGADAPGDTVAATADSDMAGGEIVEAPAEESAEDASRAGAPEIVVRSDFDALAVYAPDETTAADGTVRVEVPLPDNLTRYRAMAVAVDGAERFGKGESTITARLPLLVRPSAPRFLNFGDTFELPVVLQNQTDEPMEVEVALEAANLRLTEEAGQRVSVPADDRVEVRFPVSTDSAGTARFRVAAVSGDAADSAEIDLPVYTPATTEAFATYGVLDEGAVAQPVTTPTGVYEQFGGLEINTSSTALQALTDAVLYLSDYRYVHTDGLASRILAISALRDVLDAFDAEGLPDSADLEEAVRMDIDQLVARQNDDGGWPVWRRGEPSRPFVSVATAQSLVAAVDAGYSVPGDTIERALEWLRTIEQHYPDDHSEEIERTISAYALNVRNQAGDRDPAKAQTLYDRFGDELGLDALAWLWPVLDDPATGDEIEQIFKNRAVETAGAATFTVDYGEDAYLLAYSDQRTDGIILDALISERPDSDLIPKLVAGLLGNQVQGRWNNAYENGFVLLAMKHYFDTFEGVTPDFVARVWLGDTYAAEHEYRGRTTDRATTVVPTSELIGPVSATPVTEDLIVAKDGAGRLYYRLGMRYAPVDLTLDPLDEGFVVDRVYEPVDDPDDVVLGDDGVWRVKAGATVRVRLTMVADARRTNMVLIDPLPAGLEPLNSALSVSMTPPPEPEDDPAARDATWCWCWQWYEHENLRDDRAEAYATYLGAGTYEYVYEARATTPGDFVVPPARAEEVFAPEVFGRSASTRLTVA